jgi:transposase
MLKHCKLSTYTIKKIMKCFCIDIEASKTAKLLAINRNSVNRFYLLFRLCIALEQTRQKALLVGEIELDESYFGATRPRGVAGKLKRGRGTCCVFWKAACVWRF